MIFSATNARKSEVIRYLRRGSVMIRPLKQDQRFTLPADDWWCREKAGVTKWDLDVAACAQAHLADRYYTVDDNGLIRPWFGRVWCNPPFSDIGPWVERTWAAIHGREAGLVAMLLPATRTEQPWWQKHVEPFRDNGNGLTTHFLPRRTRFGNPADVSARRVGSPPFTCVLLVFKTIRRSA